MRKAVGHVPLFLLVIFLASPAFAYAHPAITLLALAIMIRGFYALYGQNLKAHLLLGLAMALCYHVVSTWFMPNAISILAGTGPAKTWLLFVPFILLQGLPFYLFSVFFYFLNQGHEPSGPLKPALALTLCFSLIWQLVPDNMTFTLVPHAAYMQLARFGGWPLVMFVFCYAGCALAWSLFMFKQRGRWLLSHVVIAGLLVVVSLWYGTFALQLFHKIPQKVREGRTLRIGYIQPNITPALTDEFRKQRTKVNNPYRRFFSMTRDLVKQHKNLDAILWAEVPMLYYDYYHHKDTFIALQQDTGVPLFANISGTLHNGEQYNAMAQLDATGRVENFYNKIFLLPFSAYIPFEKNLPFLRSIFPNAGNYKPGDEAVVMSFAEIARGIPTICYESVFASRIRPFVDLGGNLILDQTNDAAFGQTPGAIQHIMSSAMRAVEFNLPIVRATNTGISVLIEASGELTGATDIYTRASGVFEVYIPAERSFYTRYGDWFLYLCGGLLVVLLFFRRRLFYI